MVKRFGEMVKSALFEVGFISGIIWIWTILGVFIVISQTVMPKGNLVLGILTGFFPWWFMLGLFLIGELSDKHKEKHFKELPSLRQQAIDSDIAAMPSYDPHQVAQSVLVSRLYRQLWEDMVNNCVDNRFKDKTAHDVIALYCEYDKETHITKATFTVDGRFIDDRDYFWLQIADAGEYALGTNEEFPGKGLRHCPWIRIDNHTPLNKFSYSQPSWVVEVTDMPLDCPWTPDQTN